MKYSKKDIAQAWNYIESYRNRPIHAEVIHVSRSGMSRRIRFYSVPYDGSSINDITWSIARICGLGMNDQGLRVDGCGMDMCFSVISNFNYIAWKYDCLKRFPDTDWTLVGYFDTKAKELMGYNQEYRIYDTYFFDANRL